MKITNIGNSSSYYKECTNYIRTSNKYIKSLRIASRILKQYNKDAIYSYCEFMFPSYDSNFIMIEKLGVKIVLGKNFSYSNKIYFTFVM